MQMKQNVLFLYKALLNLITNGIWCEMVTGNTCVYWINLQMNFSVQFMKSIKYLIGKSFNYEVNHILLKITKNYAECLENSVNALLCKYIK